MIACGCKKCSVYGNASYCVNDIIDQGKAEYESAKKKSSLWANVSLWGIVVFCAIPVVARILDCCIKS